MTWKSLLLVALLAGRGEAGDGEEDEGIRQGAGELGLTSLGPAVPRSSMELSGNVPPARK